MPRTSFSKAFGVAIGSGECAIRINSDEIDDAIKTITEVAKKHKWELRVWDDTVGTIWYNGTAVINTAGAPGTKSSVMQDSLQASLQGMSSPAGAPNTLNVLLEFLDEMPKPDLGAPGEIKPVILLMKNFHLAFETSKRGPVVSAVQHLITDKVNDHPRYKDFAEKLDKAGIDSDSDTGKFIVGIMPLEARLPPEVSPLFK